MSMLNVSETAERLGVSYPTLKQWIYKKKITATKTPGGHYRISDAEIERLLGAKLSKPKSKSKDDVLGALSLRNKLRGKIVFVKVDGLLAQVTMETGGQFVSAIVTSEACKELGLKSGVMAYTMFKATDAMISLK